MLHPCRIAGCHGEVLPALAADGVCLSHFVEIVIERADRVRACCIDSQPADQEVVDWLLGDARETARALSTLAGGTTSEEILELLLCLANLQEYMTHHSLRVNRIVH